MLHRVAALWLQLSSGKFEDSKSGKSFGEIRSIRCNADGSRVSILASQKISEKARCVLQSLNMAVASVCVTVSV